MGARVEQPFVLEADFKGIASMTAVAFWLFIGAEYAIPISKEVKNAKRNVPLGMMIGLFLIFIMQSVMVFGFHIMLSGENLPTQQHHTFFMDMQFLGSLVKYG